MKASYEELEKRVAELEKKEFENTAILEKYQVLFNQNPDAVVIIDPKDASLVEFNDQLCRQLGYSREELSKLKIPDIEAIETFEDTKKRIQSIMDNGSATFETKQRTKSGEIRDILIIAQYIKLDNKHIYHCIWRDITETKNKEIIIKKNEEKLKSYLNSSPIGIFVTDKQGNYIDVNPAACQIAGYDEPDLLKMTIKDIINPIEMERAYKHFTKVQTKGFADGVFMGIRKNGEHYWFSVVATKIDDEHFIGYSRDVTHRIMSDRKLRESEAQLDNAMKLAKMGNWFYDVEQDLIFFTDNFYSIFDTSAEEMGGYSMTVEEYEDKFAHPGEPNAVRKQFNKSISTNDPNYKNFVQTTIIAPNGNVKKIAVRTFLQKDENGKTIRIYGVNQDITELKEAENDLQMAKEKAEQSENQLKTLVKSMPDLVWLKDINGKYISCNYRFEQFFGAKECELTGKTDYDFLDKEIAEFFISNDKKVIESGLTNINEELLTFASDGHIEYTETIKTPVYGSNKEIIGVLGIGRDITLRKEQEAEIIESKNIAEENERKLKAVNEIARVGYWELNQETKIFTFTDNFYNIFKTSAEEMGGYQIPIEVYANKFLHPDDAHLVAEENIKALESKDPNYTSTLEHRIIFADGSTGFMSVKIFLVKDEYGNTIKTYGVNQDITDRKIKEEEIKKLNEKYESFISNSTEAVYCLEFEEPIDLSLPLEEQVDNIYKYGYIGHCNLTIAKMYGLNSVDDFLNKRVVEIHGGSNNPQNRDTFKQFLLNNCKTQDLETVEVGADGQIIYFLNNDRGVVEDGKLHRIWGITRDITDRKKYEKEIKAAKEKAEENERQMHQAQKTSKMGNWVWYIQENRLWWSDEMYNIFDIDKETFSGDLSQVINEAIHPDDRTLVEQSNLSVINENNPIPTEYRIILKNGQEKYVLGLADEIIVDENGKSKILTGIVKDISDYKLIQLELLNEKLKLEKSEQRLQTIFDTLSEGVALNEIVYDENGEMIDYKILEVNKSFYKVSNIDESTKVVGNLATQYYGMTKELIKDFWINHKNTKNSATTLMKSPVEEKWFHVSTSPFFDNKFITTFFDVTDRVLSEKELIKAKERAEENEYFLKESQKIGNVGSYMLDFSNGIWTSSEILNQIFGIKKEMKKDIELWENLIYYEDRDMMINYFGVEVLQKKQKFDKEYRIVRQSDSAVRWVYGLGELSYNEKGNLKNMLGTIQDITERKIVEQELLEAKRKAEINERKYKSLFTDMTNGFALHKIIVDDNGKPIDYIVTEVNPAYERLTSLKANDLVNKRIKEIFPNLEDEWIQTTGEVALTGKPVNIEIYSKVVEKYFAVSIFSQEIGYFATFFNDITDRKKAEIELMNAKERAEESDRLKSAFLCNVSHEIRTPLNAIVGFSALLNDEDLSREERESFNNIIKSRSNDLLNIINDILDISQIEANQMKVNITEGRINDFVDEIYKTFRLKMNIENKNHLEFDVIEKFASDIDLIRTDFHRVKQIISNFLTNALKFTKQGSIKIGAKLSDNKIIFSVADTGIGINKEDLPKVFERFRQVEYSDKRNYGGNGLGLAISKGLAELLGGRIWAESEINVGSTFYLSIPFDPINPIKKHIVIDEEIHRGDKKHKILIIEDDQYNLFFLEKLVKSFGFEYLSAKTGKMAIELFNENTDIDLILLDIQLPDISGLELLQIFKTERFDVPVIAQTAFAMEEDKVRILESGCDDYIPKPIMRELLLKKMKQFFE